MFLIYQSVAEAVFGVFRCYERDIGGQQLLLADFGIDCNSSKHTIYKAVSVSVGVLFCVGLPVGVALGLRRNVKVLLDSAYFFKFRFMYRGYSVKKGIYFWESLVMLRKLTIVCVPVVIANSYAQSVTVLLALVIFIVLQMAYQPYIYPWLNRLELLSLLDVYFVQVVALLYLSSEDNAGLLGSFYRGSDSASNESRNATVTAVLLLTQVAVFGTFGYFYVREYRRQQREKREGRLAKGASSSYDAKHIGNETSDGAVELTTTLSTRPMPVSSMRFQNNPMSDEIFLFREGK